jgi:hypothetical protein
VIDAGRRGMLRIARVPSGRRGMKAILKTIG